MPNQRFVEAKPSAKHSAPSFRLRHVLWLVALGLMVLWAAPRVVATMELHDRAVRLADYSLCLLGPTGPSVVRAEHPELEVLVRRRVIGALPADVPLRSCFGLAEKLGVSYKTLKLHQIQASDFVEYHNDPLRPGRHSVRELALPLEELEQLTQRAWPFVRGGYADLVVASSHARQTPHPATPPEPGWGSGLPASNAAYRSTAAFGDTAVVAYGSGAHRRTLLSTNAGVDWAPGGRRLADELADRCVIDDDGRAFSLSKLNDGQRVVVSHGPAAAPQVAILGPKDSRLAGVSCDDRALVALLVGQELGGYRPLTLRLCPFRGACRDMHLPDMAGAALYFPADVARMGGDTILTRTLGGITRVTSSRDDGQTWAPWIVVYDTNTARVPAAAPFRLLPVGQQLLLYAGASDGARYPLLISDDHGASFRAPRPRGPSATEGVARN